jgi:hypothetical protein
MIKKAKIFFVLLLSISVYLAQDSTSFEDKMKFGVQLKTYEWAHKNLFLDLKITPIGGEYLIYPHKRYNYINYDSNNEIEDTTSYTDKSVVFSIFSLTLEPRVNILSSSNSSIFFKSPLSLNLSAVVNRKYNNSNKVFPNVNAMFLIGYSQNLNSTFNSTKSTGFAVSLGVDLYQGPFVLGSPDTTNLTRISNYDFNGDGFYEERRSFVSPLAQFDYYWLTNKYRIRGASVSISPLNGFHLKFSLSFTLSEK